MSLGRNKSVAPCHSSLWTMVETEKNSWNWQLAESVKVSWMLPALFLITVKAVEVLVCEVGAPDPQELEHSYIYEKGFEKLPSPHEEPVSMTPSPSSRIS